MIALQVSNTCGVGRRSVLGALDPFGHRSETKGVDNIEQITQCGLLLSTSRKISDEGSIYFNRVHGEQLKMAQRGVAGTEIVEGNPATEATERVHETR